jgi:peptidoglycan/LPS O-acetylase OafA/YrhL
MVASGDHGSLAVKDDPGTAAGDRSYRPDVEGLRAVAVIVVVFFHSRLPGFPGGYVGVDIFYVISGFVITGVLLRKVESRGSVDFGDFYARRARRILPAAGLVLICTVLASYQWLGFIRGAEVASDAQWCAVFLGNLHFSSVGTNYLQSQLPPSPLQNYWSLGVEEQFYVFYPAAIGLCLLTFSSVKIRTKILIFTAAVIVVSLGWSVYQTSTNPSVAYFSSLTRAWELGLGGFVTAGTTYWLRIPRSVAICLTWAGIVGMAVAVTQFSSATTYPGWAAALPVFSAALVIVGGMSAGRWGAELFLGTAVFGWVGKRSFSLYLWAWPVLTIGVESAANGLNLAERMLTVLVSVALAAITYALVENPIRHSKWLAKLWWRGPVLGAAIIILVLIVATVEMNTVRTL